jgi:phosphatidate phosphatase APP1
MNPKKVNIISRNPQSGIIKRIQKKCLQILGLTNKPVIRVYNGYGNETSCILFGHTLQLSPLPPKKYTSNFLLNILALLRLFMVKPLADIKLSLIWQNKTIEALSDKEGFFRFEFEWGIERIEHGWHMAEVYMHHKKTNQVMARATAKIMVPYPSQYAFISDIDDTFLISHSAHLRKRLYVLLTKNARSRRPFDGVVKHYQLLSKTQGEAAAINPFFYVSSSEWNLYNYIHAFSAQHILPEGVYLLNKLKTIGSVFKTGQNNHSTKFMRIARILEAYPTQQFVLLGDDSQEDPTIYAAIVSYFPKQIFCVYIRHVLKKTPQVVLIKIREIKKAGTYCCYFFHSAEAILHSKQIGLIV